MPLFQYTTGDLLRSSAGALVNTVNCEGFMGKGIAYQFKQQYPETFQDYEGLPDGNSPARETAYLPRGWQADRQLPHERPVEKPVQNGVY